MQDVHNSRVNVSEPELAPMEVLRSAVFNVRVVCANSSGIITSFGLIPATVAAGSLGLTPQAAGSAACFSAAKWSLSAGLIASSLSAAARLSSGPDSVCLRPIPDPHLPPPLPSKIGFVESPRARISLNS
jgi:hypothetical protein